MFFSGRRKIEEAKKAFEEINNLLNRLSKGNEDSNLLVQELEIKTIDFINKLDALPTHSIPKISEEVGFQFDKRGLYLLNFSWMRKVTSFFVDMRAVEIADAASIMYLKKAETQGTGVLFWEAFMAAMNNLSWEGERLYAKEAFAPALEAFKREEAVWLRAKEHFRPLCSEEKINDDQFLYLARMPEQLQFHGNYILTYGYMINELRMWKLCCEITINEGVSKNNVQQLMESFEGRESWLVRPAVARILGLFKVHDAVPLLVKSLRDSEPSIRQEAVKALGNIGDKSVGPTIIECLSDEDLFTIWNAVDALAQIDDQSETQRIALSQALAWAKRGGHPELEGHILVAIDTIEKKREKG